MAAYKHNLGMMEMIQLQNTATETQLEQLDRIVKNEDWEEYKELVEEVLHVSLN